MFYAPDYSGINAEKSVLSKISTVDDDDQASDQLERVNVVLKRMTATGQLNLVEGA